MTVRKKFPIKMKRVVGHIIKGAGETGDVQASGTPHCPRAGCATGFPHLIVQNQDIHLFTIQISNITPLLSIVFSLTFSPLGYMRAQVRRQEIFLKNFESAYLSKLNWPFSDLFFILNTGNEVGMG